MANGTLTHYDRPRIAQLCEKANLYMRALQHYSDLPDIKRVIINTHAIDPQQLVEFFGSLSAEWALDCLRVSSTHIIHQTLVILLGIISSETPRQGSWDLEPWLGQWEYFYSQCIKKLFTTYAISHLAQDFASLLQSWEVTCMFASWKLFFPGAQQIVFPWGSSNKDFKFHLPFRLAQWISRRDEGLSLC